MIEDLKEGLNMMTEESILKGGLFGSAILIGDSQSSEIIRDKSACS